MERVSKTYLVVIVPTVIFTQNSLFLYFCFELLHKKGFSCFLYRKRRTIAYRKIGKYFLERMNVFQLDVADLFTAYPALLDLAYSGNDAKAQSFLVKILSKCNKTEMLYLRPSHPIDLFLKYLNLSSIYLSNGNTSVDFEVIAQSTPDDLKIVLINQEEMHIPKFVGYANRMGKKHSFYFIGNGKSEKQLDICQFLSSNVRRIVLWQKSHECVLEVGSEIPECVHLTQLSIGSPQIRFQNESLKALSEAVDDGKFPVLSHVCLPAYSRQASIRDIVFKLPSLTDLDIKQNLEETAFSALTQNVLPRLDFLSISGWFCSDPHAIQLKDTAMDLTTLKLEGRIGGIFTDGLIKAKLFPKLRELKLAESNSDLTRVLTSEQLANLTSLTIQESNLDMESLSNCDIFSKLHELNLSHCPLSSKLSDFLHKLPALVSLILSGCKLGTVDFHCLAQAYKKERLPNLRHLNLSHNNDGNWGNVLECLFYQQCKWDKITCLNIESVQCTSCGESDQWF